MDGEESTKITEVTGITGDVITTQDLFVFEQTGLEDGKIVGHFTPTGNIPGFMDRIKNAGAEFPKGFFAPK
jgi:pilus assembly protein CpaF